jgi:hypothetical protein
LNKPKWKNRYGSITLERLILWHPWKPGPQPTFSYFIFPENLATKDHIECSMENLLFIHTNDTNHPIMIKIRLKLLYRIPLACCYIIIIKHHENQLYNTKNEYMMLFQGNIPYIFNHENKYYPTLQTEQNTK